MLIERKRYLDKLINKKNNGLIKVITGIRRCGKSFLLFDIFNNYLIQNGVDSKNIIKLSLDEAAYSKYRNPFELDKFIRKKVKDINKEYYVFLDEIQNVVDIQNPYIKDVESKVGFVDVLLGLMKLKNIDIYVTGSNSRMLSSDIITQFKDRGDEIKVNPLTYSEFYSAFEGKKENALKEYFMYGGMPILLSRRSHEEKSKYLKELFSKTYISDVIERNKILKEKDVLEELLDIIASSIGSFTNPSKLSNTFESVKKRHISSSTISNYLDFFIDAFILNKAYRYDIKGKKYINTPMKYYFSDIGLRNARLNFRQQENTHIMENIIYNELCTREFDIDVGMVEYNTKDSENKSNRIKLEVDFVANKGTKRYYIQSAFMIVDEEKRIQETNSLYRIDDSFRKIIIVRDDIIPWHDEKGVLYLGLEQFLLDERAIDL